MKSGIASHNGKMRNFKIIMRAGQWKLQKQNA
jgi:hypothetical protein